MPAAREPCQAAMLSPVSFWKASGLEVGDFGPVGPVRTRMGCAYSRGFDPEGCSEACRRASNSRFRAARARKGPAGLRKHESGTGQPKRPSQT